LIFRHRHTTMKCMKTTQTKADTKALLEHVATGSPLDAETYRRIRERQEAITADLRKRHGAMDIAVDLIRAVRDES
jgi:hypothetical protein